jgi:L-rhamnose mutarotase
MERIAFRMKLNAGCAAEYRQRHDKIWPELQRLLKDTGISEYSIFLDENTNDLFGFMKVDDNGRLRDLKNEPVMLKWWQYMKDIMETNPDGSPQNIPLKEVFYLL